VYHQPKKDGSNAVFFIAEPKRARA
jgi:hypothetical protein